MPVDIVTKTVDLGRVQTPQFQRNESRMAFSVVDNTPPPPQAKASVLGGILSAIGLGSQIGWAFPPFGAAAAIGGAGLGGLGAQMKANRVNQAYVQAAQQPPMVMTMPGITTSPVSYQGTPIQNAPFSDPTLDLITFRNTADTAAIKGFK